MSILQIFIGVVLVAEGLFVWRYGRKQLGMVLAVNAFVNVGAVLLLAQSFMAPSMAALGALGANDGLSQMSSMFFWMWVGGDSGANNHKRTTNSPWKQKITYA